MKVNGRVKTLYQRTRRFYHAKGLSLLFKNIAFLFARLVFEFVKAVCCRPKDVLYISGCPGGSKFYRCLNQQEELNHFGIKSRIFSQHSPFLNLLVKKHEVFIFQRVIYTPKISLLVKELKRNNKLAAFETDDLVFDPDFIRFMAYYNEMGPEEQNWYKNGIGKELLEDDYFAHVIVSTETLKTAVLAKYPLKKVFISSNKLSRFQVLASQKALRDKNRLKPDDGKIRIGYFSGSKSHNKDFAVVENELLNILSKNHNVVLMVAGYLKISDVFNQFEDRIERFEFVSLDRYYQLMLRADINIAPLEINNPFCQAKSALKFFEAALLKIPTVASGTQPFELAITDGSDGFVAYHSEQWTSCLERLIKDCAFREKMGQNAYWTAKQYYAIPQLKLSEPSSLIHFIKQKQIEAENRSINIPKL